MALVGSIDLGTYRTADGDLVHCWYDATGVLMAERERGKVRVDTATLMTAVKLSDDPLWPDVEAPIQVGLWRK